MTTQQRPYGLGVGVVFGGAAFAALTNVLAPLGYLAGANPLTLISVRYVIFLGICAIALWIWRQSPRVSSASLARAYIGGVFYSIAAIGLLTSFALIPVSLSILIFYMFPIITLIAESVLDRRPPGMLLTVCACTAFVGLILALQVDVVLDWHGIAAVACGALGLSASYIWADRALQDMHPVVSSFHIGTACLVIGTALMIALGQFQLPDMNHNYAVAFWAAAIGFAGMFFGQFVGVNMIGAGPTSMIMNLEPVFTIVLAVLMLGESVGGRQLLGAGLVIAAVTVSQIAVHQTLPRVSPPG